jgi:hypothetical protein
MHWHVMGSQIACVVKLPVFGSPVDIGWNRMNVVGYRYTLERALRTFVHSYLHRCSGYLNNY